MIQTNGRGGDLAANKATRDKLARLGIHRPFDLVLHLPLRYDDETRLVPIAKAVSNAPALVEGLIVEAQVRYRPRRQLVVTVKDDSGIVIMRLLNFYPSQVNQLAAGARVRLFGEIRQGFFGAEMVHPKYRIVKAQAPIAKTLTPVYPTTAGMGQASLSRLIDDALSRESLEDTLPAEICSQLKLPPFERCVRFLHHPPAGAAIGTLQDRSNPAWLRIKFDELLAQQISMHLHRHRRATARAPALVSSNRLASRLLKQVSFRLTRAQTRALKEISEDLARTHPMHRLLQGDVGSGKTIVAALAALQAIDSGYQVAIMAPTEILGEQHYNKFSKWFGALGIDVVWLAGSLKGAARRQALDRIADASSTVVVGTHALIQDSVEFPRLGLAIVDEQHRFGVRQRLALRTKGDSPQTSMQPHQLMMSATPIPRTLAMSYYADLDVSVIDELPPGRSPVATRLVNDSRRDEVIQRVRDACMSGSQAYWVCPLIEEQEAAEIKQSSRGRRRKEALQMQSTMETYERLAATFPELRIGLVHGRLAAAEKAQVMQRFLAGDIQLLVATTVIEVGVDVPNATLMIIENAERMGLAQLHQLRGRVGRGGGASTCILLYQNPLSELARARLKIIFENSDGFEIARHDLRIRGPGEMLGARQSGEPLLRFADLESDVDLIEKARDCARHLLRTQPEIAQRHLDRWLGGRQQYLSA